MAWCGELWHYLKQKASTPAKPSGALLPPPEPPTERRRRSKSPADRRRDHVRSNLRDLKFNEKREAILALYGYYRDKGTGTVFSREEVQAFLVGEQGGLVPRRAIDVASLEFVPGTVFRDVLESIGEVSAPHGSEPLGLEKGTVLLDPKIRPGGYRLNFLDSKKGDAQRAPAKPEEKG